MITNLTSKKALIIIEFSASVPKEMYKEVYKNMNTDVTVKRLKINDVSIAGTLKMQNKIPTMLDFLL